MLRFATLFFIFLFSPNVGLSQVSGKFAIANKALADSLKGQTKYLRIEAIKCFVDVFTRSDVTYIDSSGAVYYRIGDDLINKAGRWNSADDFVAEMRHDRRESSILRWPSGTKVVINKVELKGKSIDIGLTNLDANKTEIHLSFERVVYTVTDFRRLLSVAFADSVAGLLHHPIKLELGMPPDAVIRIKGQPKTHAELGEKIIFTYDDVKVIFLNGKLSDVQ